LNREIQSKKTIMRRMLTVSLIGLLVLGVGSSAAFEREIPVRSGGLVEVDLETGGTIAITGWSRGSVQESADWDYDEGSPRKTIRGVGRGGGSRVVIQTVNGNVYFKKSR
jgi:hypothetical protein